MPIQSKFHIKYLPIPFSSHLDTGKRRLFHGRLYPQTAAESGLKYKTKLNITYNVKIVWILSHFPQKGFKVGQSKLYKYNTCLFCAHLTLTQKHGVYNQLTLLVSCWFTKSIHGTVLKELDHLSLCFVRHTHIFLTPYTHQNKQE